jgi:bifunctional UDP-N-acetylglucosamine pyrophosphorylase / glucosamine-1-phosphate N-acetyltransferase
MNLATVILAAGQGTRMRSKLPKVLHPLGGQPMVMYAVNLSLELSDQLPVVVVGHGARLVQNQLGDCVTYVLQERQLGTGHAVLQAREELREQSDAVLVLYGDMPLLTPQTVRSLAEAQDRTQAALAVLTLRVAPDADKMGFGRILRSEQGQVVSSVEEAVATPEQKAIRELNCGVYCFRADWLWARLDDLQISAKGEYYLPDLIGLAVQEGERIETVTLENATEVLGINDRVHLAQAERILRRRVNERLMMSGVTMIDPATTYVEPGVEVAPDTVLYPNTHLQGSTVIAEDCLIGPNAVLRDTIVGPRCRVVASFLESARLEADVSVGPFGHLRSGARLEAGVHMGNFGEVKNSTLGAGTKMGHFSYVGDATIGMNVNIGAGTVTCNYDGERKNPTLIGDEVFIGSGTMLVAPVELGPGSKIGAGSVVTHDVPPNVVAFGVPARVKRTVVEELPQGEGEPAEREE